MDPNSNTPPTEPVTQPQPNLSTPIQPAVAPMPEQAVPLAPGQAMPAPQPQPMPAADPMSARPMNQSTPAQPAPAPQPMFSPMTPPMPGQPMGGQPPFTQMAASQMPKPRGKKRFFIIGGVVLVLIIVGVFAFVFASKATLIGPLSSDSYEGLNYKRPAAWVKDSSSKSSINYHPKTAIGKSTSGDPTYALKMNVSAQKGVFQTMPNDLSAADKATLQKVIDQEIAQGSSNILPSKSDVGCDDNPVFKDKPEKIDIKDSFLAVKYSFTCKSGSGSSATTFYFSVVDVAPNNKDIEYILDIGAASESIYKTNLTTIDNIVRNVSF